jgi:SpoVK/Ycf46/Vps4 family AAA+-type ATPase
LYEVKISLLREIEWAADPYHSLQLSVDRKRLVHKLVKGFNTSGEDVYDDIIKGKGKGLIFLLHGPPGLGKTLTAGKFIPSERHLNSSINSTAFCTLTFNLLESVAESARRPLYRVTTGELSINVGDLETQLSDIFRLGARWKAVVLLDEADVLMSQRTVNNLQQNSIVAGMYFLSFVTKAKTHFSSKGSKKYVHSLPPTPRILPRHAISNHQPTPRF